MKAGIIGTGKIGRLHAATLRKQNATVFTIDPVPYAQSTNHYPSLSSLSFEEISAIDLWIIATPTENHVSALSELLAVVPDAKVLVEKPVCIPGEVGRLRCLMEAHPKSQVSVNDIYANSPVIEAFATRLKAMKSRSPLKNVHVEFTKNRSKDSTSGRFTDNHYGDVGYEWFHILSALRATIGEREFQNYLSLPTVFSDIKSTVSERTMVHGLPRIHLASSMNGHIQHSTASIVAAYWAANARRMASRGNIPWGSEFRYRVIDAHLENGDSVTLVFENLFGVTGTDYKNEHLLISVVDGRTTMEVIKANQHEIGLLRQVSALLVNNEPLQDIALDVHRRMADIARNIKEGHARASQPIPNRRVLYAVR